MKEKLFRHFSFLVLATAFYCRPLSAQTAVQKNGKWLPANFAVDAKLMEWNDVLSANNKATRLRYTLANNDSLLYLAVKSSDVLVNARILTVGITLTIAPDGRKSGGKFPMITFPARSEYTANREPVYVKEPTLTFPESIRSAILGLKDILVSNVSGIAFGKIPVYNEEGIRAKIRYIERETLIYEMIIPRKLIGLASDKGLKKFDYSIRVNACPAAPADKNGWSAPPPAAATGSTSMRLGTDTQSLYSSTYFWASYEFAKAL